MTTVSIGPGMGPDEEAEHAARQAETAADEAENGVKLAEQTLRDLEASIADRKRDAELLREQAVSLRARVGGN